MAKNIESIIDRQTSTKSIAQKSIESEFARIITDIEKQKDCTMEQKVSKLNTKMNQLRLSPKSSSQKLATLIQNEIDSILSQFERTDEVAISLEKFYQIEKKVDLLKFDKSVILSAYKYFKLYFSAFLFTIPDKKEESFATLILPEPKVLTLSSKIYTHPLEFNNDIYEFYENNKKKNTKFNKILSQFLSKRFGLSSFNLSINEGYKTQFNKKNLS